MKVIVQTTGSFSLIDDEQKVEITKRRPHLVKNTNFVSMRAALGQLRVLATNIDNSKTDEEWREHYLACDGNLDLAIESFTSVPEPAPPQTKRTRKS